MRRTSIIRILCTVVAALVVAAVGIGVTLRLVREPAGAATAPLVPDRPPFTQTTPSTLSPSPPTKPPAATPPPPTVSPVAPTTTAPPTTIPPTPSAPAGVAGSLKPGDSGPDVVDLQDRLRGLGYWLGEVDGTYGHLAEQAVTAFQKVEGLVPDGAAGPATLQALAVAERPPSSASGDLVEVDKALQILFVIRDGAVLWTLNTSTGTEEPYEVDGRTELADTPVGHWKVSWAVDGDDVGALGALYRPRYFHPDGIAVHGYYSVPAYPASHGCVRVSEGAMDWIWAESIMPIGSVVWVH